MEVNLLLITVIVLGAVVNNTSLLISGILLLLLNNLKLIGVLQLIDKYSVKLGIILIMLGVLSSLVTGGINLKQVGKRLLDPLYLLAVGMGIAVTQFTREGIQLLETRPTITINLVLGVIIGVAFFRGVPSGPLIAGGITAVTYQLISLIF